MTDITNDIFDKLNKNKIDIIKNYKIRDIIGKPGKNISFIEHFELICKDKDKKNICTKIRAIFTNNNLVDVDMTLFKRIIGSIDKYTDNILEDLTCYILVMKRKKELTDNSEMRMKNYEGIYNSKGKISDLIDNFNKVEISSMQDTGLTKEILDDLINNKDKIIKNFYYRLAIENKDIKGKTKLDIKGKTKLDKFINYVKTKDAIDKINEQSKNPPNNLFEKIISSVREFDDWTIDYLTVFSSIIEAYNDFNLKNIKKSFIDNLEWKDWRNKAINDYDNIFYNIKLTEKWDRIKYDKMIDFMKKNSLYICKGSKKYTFKNNLITIQKKIEDRNGELNMIETKGKKSIWKTSYNDKPYILISNNDKVSICIDLTPTHTEEEYKFFIEFIEEAYSPIFNAMEQSSNLPSGSNAHKELKRRKSLIKIDSIKYVPENTKLKSPTKKDIETESKIKDKLKTDIESSPAIKNNSLPRSKDILTDIMKCMRNDRYSEDQVNEAREKRRNNEINDKQLKEIVNQRGPGIIWKQTLSNFHREPFIKYVLHFPSKCNGSEDSKLVQIVKREFNNALVCIIEKNPTDKEYFLIDSEGGGHMHFDYSLYAFTKDQLNKSEHEMMTKSNLWKKLEFKSNETARSISGLTEFVSKAPEKLFATSNLTFYKEFKININNKKWLTQNITGNNYFTQAIENLFQGQKNKTFIIWNTKDQKIYLDEFYPEELIVKRIKKIPQIKFDEYYFDKNKKIKINVEMEKESFEIQFDGKSFKFDFKPNQDRKNIYSDCLI